MNYEHLFNQIDKQRELKGLNPSLLCRKADVSQMSWSNLKNPKKGVNTETIFKFAKVLDLSEIILKIE